MTDSHVSPQSSPQSPASNTLQPRGPGKQPDRTPTPRSSMTMPSADDGPSSEPRLPPSNHAHHDVKRHSTAAQRSHKHRSSGTFLLSDPLHTESAVPDRAHSHRRRPTATDNHTSSRAATPDKRSSVISGSSQTLTPESGSRLSARTPDTMSGVVAAQRDSLTDTSTHDGLHRSSVAPLDMDSTQIVSMALNLSESRRLAAKRNISSPLPPRLAPLPDSTAGGSLRQHLQQQRKASRNISPRPGATARTASGQKPATPLQPAFDHDGGYRYHFSQSTLSRAQKAKEHLELLAQYRKVLELVPPLTPHHSRRPSTVSPRGSPAASHSVSRTTTRSVDFGNLGRPYNPLQYIRNRKVRARERKTIDGEAQGFSDVPRVSEWVAEAAKSVAAGQVADSGSTLPTFHTPEEVADGSPQSALQHSGAAPRSKRPRVDWVIDPADMLADVYWLEQGNNKNLVEDRNWKRVCEQDSSLSQPVSRQTGERTTLPEPPAPLLDSSGLHVETDPVDLGQKTSRGEHDHVFGSARERAHQKLQAMRGLHHRHNGSFHHRQADFLHSRNGSLSDFSDTDSDRKGRNRNGTIGSSGKGILEKQMLEMIAREQREKELEAQLGPEARRQRSLTADSVALEGDTVIHSTTPSRATSHRREQSVVELNEPDNNEEPPDPPSVSPTRNARASLEVPFTGKRFSIGPDSSRPGSPEIRPTRGVGLVPAIGKDWSPRPSRATSPSRNPLSKVKSIFRERSRERAAHSDERGAGAADADSHAVEIGTTTPVDKGRKSSTERRGSISPIRKVISRGSDSSNRSPRGYGSLRLRGDETGSGLRGLFRAPRIDSVLRSGVSRVSDLFWRRDRDVGDGDSSTSSDESDAEPGRGRTRETSLQLDQPHPGAKTYLDVMPSFVPTSQSYSRLAPQGDQGLLYPAHPSSRPPSRRSSRFELLKPPKIDIQDTSPNDDPSPTQKVRSHHGSDTASAADPDSRKNSHSDAVRAADARLNAVISMPKPQHLGPPPNPVAAAAADQEQQQQHHHRHWSISAGSGRPTAQVHATVSRSELARLRALMLSSGITAHEIDRRARERRRLPAGDGAPESPSFPARTWTAALHHPDPDPDPRARARALAQTEVFPAAARALAAAAEAATRRHRRAARDFEARDAVALHRRVEGARARVAGRLSDLSRAAADEADEVARDLGQGQRLKVKRVVDVIEKMLRRRRRRFRWVRRGLWLGVEWVLVGFMWYVWFVVVIARMVLGVGKGVVGAVRWLLWL